MSALHAYQVAHAGAVRDRDARSVLNREAARIAERIADDGREVEPEPDLMYLWVTSDTVRGGRPHDQRYRKWGKPYRYHNDYTRGLEDGSA